MLPAAHRLLQKHCLGMQQGRNRQQRKIQQQPLHLPPRDNS